MKPYTYLLHHIPTNTFYYGARWRNGCHPDEFWKGYFTSSDQIALLRTLFADDTFEFEIRRTFDTGKEAANWECKVLQRMKVLDNQDMWLNKTTNSAWLYEVHPATGTKRPDTSQLMKGNTYGKLQKFDDNRRKKHSENKKGKFRITDGIINRWIDPISNIPKGFYRGFTRNKPRSPETIEKQRIALNKFWQTENGIKLKEKLRILAKNQKRENCVST